MKKRAAVVLIAIFIVALGAGIVVARFPNGSSANYAIPWDVVSGGGNEMSSTNYAIKSTTGQPVIGPGSSNGYTIGVGYWYGEGERMSQVFLPMVTGE